MLNWNETRRMLSRHDWQRKTAAATPWDGLVIGNADMGATIYGPPYKLAFRLGKLDLWDARMNAEHYWHPLPLSKFKEKIAELSKNAAEAAALPLELNGNWDNGGKAYPCMRMAADVYLRVCNNEVLPARCEQRLRLADGVFEARFPMGWWEAYMKEIVCSAFVSWQHNVLCMKIGVPQGYGNRVVVSLWRDPMGGRSWELLSAGKALREGGEGHFKRDPRADMLPACELGVSGAAATLRQTIPGDERCPEREFAIAAEAPGNEFFMEPGGHAAIELLDRREQTVFVALASAMEAPDPFGRAQALARAAATEGWESLYKRHADAWREYWMKSAVSVQDPGLQRVWTRGFYTLGITARSGRPAPALWGMRTTCDCPAWRGDRHNNYPEYSSLFWGAFEGNREEQALNYTEFVRGYLPTAQRIAREIFECECGAFYPLCYVDGSDMYWFHHTWARSLFLAAIHAQNCWWHYQYFGDRGFLENMAYPVMRECALFYVELLKKNPAGDYTLWPTIATEIRGWTKEFKYNRDCIEDIAHVKFLMRAVLEASETLDADRDLRPAWKDILEHLAPYPTLKVDGKEEFVDFAGQSARPNYNHAVPLAPMWPAEDPEVVRDPKLREIARNTLDAWPWQDLPRKAIACMRLGLEERVRSELLGQRLQPDELGAGLKGTPFIVQEMLLTSWDGVMRVFPCWPLNKAAKFRDLRARGAFLVSAACGSGEIISLEIASERGNIARLLAPWPETVITALPGGETIEARRAGGAIEWDTRAGARYAIEKKR